MQIANKKDCTGCAACINACATGALIMKSDKYGFAYPKLHGKCIGCGKCTAACPVISSYKTAALNEENKDSVETKAYAAAIYDNNIRRESSSGGIFSVLAIHMIEKGGTVYGAAYNEDFSVVHKCIEDIRDLRYLRGVKYAQSDIEYCFRDIKKRLSSNQKVLFSGTPCQVAGLNSFLGKKYENLVLVDTVCHSIPSALVWKRYVQYRADRDNEGILPIEINLRSKETGWSRYTYSSRYKYENGKEYMAKSTDDVYMKLMIEGALSRECCGDCKFKGYNRVSDITLGDFWGIWDIYPEMDDNKGTSLILTHSNKGRHLLNNILSENCMIREVTLDEATKENPTIIKSTILNVNRKTILSMCLKGKFVEPESLQVSLIKKIARRLL